MQKKNIPAAADTEVKTLISDTFRDGDTAIYTDEQEVCLGM